MPKSTVPRSRARSGTLATSCSEQATGRRCGGFSRSGPSPTFQHPCFPRNWCRAARTSGLCRASGCTASSATSKVSSPPSTGRTTVPSYGEPPASSAARTMTETVIRKGGSACSRCSTAKRAETSTWAASAARPTPALRGACRCCQRRRNLRSCRKAPHRSASRMQASASSLSSGPARVRPRPRSASKEVRTAGHRAISIRARASSATRKKVATSPDICFAGQARTGSKAVRSKTTAPQCRSAAPSAARTIPAATVRPTQRSAKDACHPSEASGQVSERPPSSSPPNWSPR
ncbi:hypothetical protein D3C71_301520 [compost metagenome]